MLLHGRPGTRERAANKLATHALSDRPHNKIKSIHIIYTYKIKNRKVTLIIKKMIKNLQKASDGILKKFHWINRAIGKLVQCCSNMT